MLPGGSLNSADGQFQLQLQLDGNLVQYFNGKPLWDSNTSGNQNIWDVVMQTDGNLVIYNIHGNPIWESKTDGHVGATLSVQDDGNVVIYDPNGVAIWATGPK